MAKLDFGEWLPDLPDNENPGAILVKNCLPLLTSYTEFRELTTFSNALAAAAVGAFTIRDSGGTVNNFAGDSDDLYELTSSTTWSNISKSAGAYSSSFWDFTNFLDRVVATDGSTAVQYYDMNGGSSAFADLPGSPPIAKYVGVVRDFLVLGNIIGSSDVGADGLQWSGFNNTELWIPSLSTQSGFQSLRGTGGEIKRIVPGTEGVIFQENSIQNMVYIGPPTIWRWDEFTTKHGTPSAKSVAWSKDFVFYYSQEGFMQLDRRTKEITPIGENKINEWFLKTVAANEIVNIQSAINRKLNVVLWAFKTSTNNILNNRLLLYNWMSKRWAYAEVDTQFISEFASASSHLDELDTVLGAGGIDTNSISVDSDVFSGGVVSFLGFDGSNKSGTFQGDPLVAEIDTSEFSQEDRMLFVDETRPIVDSIGGTVQVAPLTRNDLNASPNIGSYVGLNSIGSANLRKTSRYHKFRVRVTGGFKHAQRIEFIPEQKGKR